MISAVLPCKLPTAAVSYDRKNSGRYVVSCAGFSIARADNFDEDVVKNADTRPGNAAHYLPNEVSSSLRFANSNQYTALTVQTVASSQPPNLALTNKQGLDTGVDAALEEDYGLLKEQIKEDRKIQLASKQEADVETTADTVKSLKRSKVIAKQVITQSSARIIGFVSQLWVSVRLFRVVALEVRPSLLSGEIDRVFLADVLQVGDVVLINDENAFENEMTAVDCETLVGYDVVTEDGRYIGKIRDYNFDLQDGKLTSLDFDAVGVSLVPSSLISTYRLDVEEVQEVLTDSILVKAGAESRIRRLTKGFWQLPNAGEKRKNQLVARSKMRNRRYAESTDLGRQPRPLPSRTRPPFLERTDTQDSSGREEPPETDRIPKDYDWVPQSKQR